MSITAMKTALSTLELAYDVGYTIECEDSIVALRTAIAEAEKSEPFCYLYYERGEEMFAPPDGYRPDDAQALYLAPQPAPKQEPSYRSVPHGHCTHPKCKEVFQEYLVLSEKIAKYEPEGKSPMILNAVPKQEPFCYLYYERGEEMFAPPDGYRPDDAQALYLAPQPAPKQEMQVVGYMVKTDQGPMYWPVDDYDEALTYCDDDEFPTRLYAAPVQAQPDHIAIPGKMVQPLTFDQIEDIWIKHGLNECDCHGFARAIEQAHGIGERP